MRLKMIIRTNFLLYPTGQKALYQIVISGYKTDQIVLILYSIITNAYYTIYSLHSASGHNPDAEYSKTPHSQPISARKPLYMHINNGQDLG